MTYPCPSVVTEMIIDTQQIKVLMDLMWGSPISVVKDSCKRHGVDEVDLEGHLAKCLGSALAELD